MRLVIYILVGLVALTSIVLAGGGPVLKMSPVANKQVDEQGIVPPLAAVWQPVDMASLQPLANDDLQNVVPLSESQRLAAENQRLMAQVSVLTRKPSDEDVVETGFGKMLVPGAGGQTVVVVRKVNGQVQVEEY